MIKIIKSELTNIEKKFNVTIFYACESGSRAWGVESTDSDYDIRFLYYHDLDWYLSLKEKKDVIERPIDEKLDITGWDLQKTLKLMRKSNPPLLEWLQSPIIYKEDLKVSRILKETFPKYYSSKNCHFHYLHMAKGNFREYLRGEEVWLKKYFYVLRPILACRWIEKFDMPVPMEFQILVEKTLQDSQLKKDIRKLIKRKKFGEELDLGPKIPSISDFAGSEIERLEKYHPEKVEYKDCFELDKIFKKIIEGV
ncbi:MAG: nucleotidyltransferase domain-containing protein [Candidatus Omnitrophica bacterium]|nr:nucleotidyltransferase domain-containing protein [Candidatus Omnitrophota bacterium]MBU4478819.1 nucleotidyltransferase domain-containing protein [Candidatus Omnitrophota bacterium]